jgi:hypothetical protein
MAEKIGANDYVQGNIGVAREGQHLDTVPSFQWRAAVYGPDGQMKGEPVDGHNLVTDEGRAEAIVRMFNGTTTSQTTNLNQWWMGLVSASTGYTFSVGDKQSVTTGRSWAEATTCNRKGISFSTAAGATTATGTYSTSLNINWSIGGALIANVSTSTGAGVLYSVGSFASKVLASSDVLSVSVTLGYTTA